MMNKNRTRRPAKAPIRCSAVALAAIITFCIFSGMKSNDALGQPTGELVSSGIPTPMAIFEDETPEIVQVSSREETPARAAQYINIEMTDAERDELAAVVWLEARGESAEGQQAVVEVVFNRVLHDSFPDTVHDVLHQGEDTGVLQFSSAPYIDQAEPGAEQYAAIDAALYGDTILPRDVVFFSQGGENDRVWGQIGGHVFCYEYAWEG